MLGLRRMEKAAKNGKTIPEIATFVQEYFPKIQALLIHETTVKTEDPILASHEVIHKMGDIFTNEEESEDLEIRRLSLQELSNNYPDIHVVDTGTNFTISLFSHSADGWWRYTIPKSRDGNILLHKGGLPRVVLKIIAGAPRETIEAELPLNDVDFIAKGEIVELYKMAEEAGGDKDGVEITESINYPHIFKSRDLDLNGCLLSEDGLVFSTQAFEAAKSGKISILANKRGIYGTEFFHYEGTKLIKNRGIMRLFKTIAEGKALEFDFLPLNKQVEFGIYWLVLANRFAKKPNAGILLDRLFYLGKQTGQVLETEKDIFDVLDRVHTKMPFFNFDGGKLDNLGLARWLTRKLAKQIDKAYRDRFNIPTYFPFQREEGDTKPYSVSLNNYKPNADVVDNFNSKWKKFTLQARERHRVHNENLLDEVSANEPE